MSMSKRAMGADGSEEALLDEMLQVEEPIETPLELVCFLHNNISAEYLHEALQFMEEPLKTKPYMSAHEFLVRWRIRAAALEDEAYK